MYQLSNTDEIYENNVVQLYEEYRNTAISQKPQSYLGARLGDLKSKSSAAGFFPIH